MQDVKKNTEEQLSAGQRYDEFISLAVHDLDSPLRKLSVFIEKLTAGISPDNSETALYIKRINSCVFEMRSLISSLAELNSITRSKGYVSCNMAAILRDVLNELEPIIKAKDATVNISSLPVVQGISDQYHLLFKKLLENSLKFGRPEIPLTIGISAEKISGGQLVELGLEKNESWYRLQIEDNGIGFGQEDAEKIFEPFNRLHGKSAYPGSAIGLAIAKKIMENHKGRIFADGEENIGARFILIIPENPG